MSRESPETKRLFIALPLERHFLGTFSRYRDKQGRVPYLRFIPERNLHITALFIGAVPAREVPHIEDAVEQVAHSMQPFSLLLRKVAYAPPNRPTDMVWAYFEQSAFLDVLVHRLYTAIQPVHIPQDSYKNSRDRVVPHVTLARFRTDIRTQKLLDLKQTGLEQHALVIDRVVVYESRAGGAGTEYVSHKEVLFGR